MKKSLLSFFTVTLLCLMTGKPVMAQELPTQKETLETIVKVNDYFMKKYADYTLPSFYGRVRPSNIWTRGVYYEGLMTLYGIYPREDYYKYAYDWADFHKWGMRNGNTTRNADDHCCGQVYIDLYNMCPSDPNMIRNIKASIDMVVNTPQVNDWWWIDAIQMAMPIYAKFGKMTGEQKYYDKMWDMYSYTRNVHGEAGMYNPKDCLWWRDQDFDPPYKEPNGEDCYWSRGNGWVYAALVRVLDEIPTNETHRQDYINDFLAMSKALKKCQREDGFWNVRRINAAGEISFAKPLHRRIKFIRYHTKAQTTFLQPFQQRQNPLVGRGFVRHVCLIICLIFRQTSRKNRLLRPLRQSRPHQKLTPISKKFSDFFFPPQRKAVRL